jgi:uncharacterized Ntn-hydrolase superfamily protein
VEWLDRLADVAAIATAVIAAWAYGSYRLKLYRRRTAVEALLAKQTRPGDDSLALEQIAAVLKLTIEQVLEAAQASKNIEGCTASYGGNERRLRYVHKP